MKENEFILQEMQEMQGEYDRIQFSIAETQASYEEYVTKMAREAKYRKLQTVLKNL